MVLFCPDVMSFPSYLWRVYNYPQQKHEEQHKDGHGLGWKPWASYLFKAGEQKSEIQETLMGPGISLFVVQIVYNPENPKKEPFQKESIVFQPDQPRLFKRPVSFRGSI